MQFPVRCFVSCLGLLALRCQAFVIQPTSFLNQQQLMFDNYQKTVATIQGFGDSLHEGAGVAAGCSSLLPLHSSSARGSKLRNGSTTSMSLASAVASRLGRTTTATAAAVACRGGGVEVNVISGVLAELANIRTPAALLGGAALGTMFVQLKPGGNKRLHLIYTMLSTSAFSLQLVCVLCSTLTYTSVASRSEAMAVSAISYLSNQMQWEFYVIRGSFVYGLFSFLGALSVRGWLTFSADGDRGSARVMMAILTSSALFLLNFIHHTHNSLTLCLGGMTKAVFWLTLRNMYPTKRRLFRHVIWVAMIWGAVKLLKLGPNEGTAEKKTVESDSPPAAQKTS